ncbi:hypothetical protein E3P99_00998 [Wallemia hederae]|uniref:Uncharacterized protein n=1 Tax=Wallemia hederae TaxID=1540922 RepID=A0A4T0FST3_9BASI|nr:hypothetical protein E3P99_00998 [Wallemia hederae]
MCIAALTTLPTELITSLVVDYGCKELLCVSKRLYNIALELLHTRTLYSPKTPREESNTLSIIQSYLQFTQRLPHSPFAELVHHAHLNLHHFTGNTRFEECGEIANVAKSLPNLKTIDIVLETVKEGENVEKLIGSSRSVKDLSIYIHTLCNGAVDAIADAVLKRYPNLEVLHIHRPDFVTMPGFDKIAQEKFIERVNKVITSKHPLNLILMKNCMDAYRLSQKHHCYTTKTYVNYFHIYSRREGNFREEENKQIRLQHLKEFYPDSTPKLHVAGSGYGDYEFDQLNEDEYMMLSPKLKKYANIDSQARDDLREAIIARNEAQALYRSANIEEFIDMDDVDDYLDYCYDDRDSGRRGRRGHH